MQQGMEPVRFASFLLRATYKGLEDCWIYASPAEFCFMWLANRYSSLPPLPKLLRDGVYRSLGPTRVKFSKAGLTCNFDLPRKYEVEMAP